MTGTDIRMAVPADIEGLVACSTGLFAEDAGTHDPTLSQDWPRLHAADSFRAQLGDDSKLVLAALAANEAAIRFYQRHGFAPRTVLLERET